MKLLHLFKKLLNDAKNIWMNNSTTAILVTMVKNDWLQLWRDTRDLLEVYFIF